MCDILKDRVSNCVKCYEEFGKKLFGPTDLLIIMMAKIGCIVFV